MGQNIKSIISQEKQSIVSHKESGNFNHGVIQRNLKKIKGNYIIVTKRDESNTLCLLKKEDCHEKFYDFINNNNINRKDEVITTFINKVKEVIKKSKQIPKDKLPQFLSSDFTLIPRLYGVLKTHANFSDTTIRPVVACTNSPTYKIEKRLNNILKLQPHNKVTYPNSLLKNVP